MFSAEASSTSALADVSEQMEQPGPQHLPQYLLEDIVNRLEDARDIAKVQLVSKEFWDAGKRVRSLRFIVLDVYHERARIIDVRSLRSGILGKTDGGESSSSQNMQDGIPFLKFKDQLVKILEEKNDLVQLRIEVESKLQAKTVPEDEKRRTDFWVSDPYFLKMWIPSTKSSLEHLCIVDYGQQAIMRRSTIIKILSENCKRLKTLDLRNMFIDTNDCSEMPSMISLTWRCVKVTGGALQDINEVMPKLQTLVLRGVSGVKRGNLTFPDLKVLFLGLFSPANDVEMDLPKLEKLQFKMQCPQKLHIRAPCLKYFAFNLKVMEPSSRVELRCMAGLQELLYGASSYITLSSFAEKNLYLEKFFLDIPWACVDQTSDIPCMALLVDGKCSDIQNVISENILSRVHVCGNRDVTPELWQWKRLIPDGLNLQMTAAGVYYLGRN